MTLNPDITFSNLIRFCIKIVDTELSLIAKEQERLERYKERNPDKVLEINSWQEGINARVDNNETLKEAFSEHFPMLIAKIKNQSFLRGRRFETGATNQFISIFRNESHKEAERHYSIANQKYIDNI